MDYEKTIVVVNESGSIVKCEFDGLVGACGDDPGRGEQRTMVMTDEEAFYQRAELVEAALPKVQK